MLVPVMSFYFLFYYKIEEGTNLIAIPPMPDPLDVSSCYEFLFPLLTYVYPMLFLINFIHCILKISTTERSVQLLFNQKFLLYKLFSRFKKWMRIIQTMQSVYFFKRQETVD